MRASPITTLALALLVVVSGGCKKPQVNSATNPAPLNPAGIPAETASHAPVDTATHFTGEVRRGERYTRSIAPNMIFRLEPDAGNDSGWTIRMIPGTDPKDQSIDCIGAVSEPMHNNRNLYIDAPDSAAQAETPAWRQHEFDFVPDASNCRIAWDLMNSVYYASKLTDERRAEAGEKLGKIPTAHGALTIVESRLAAAPDSSDPPIIEWLKFDAVLDMPP